VSEFTLKVACNLARRKMAAALKRIEQMDGLFMDLDGCLESEAERLIQRVRTEFESFDQTMRESVE
jgi:hypothetical protein